MSILVLSRLCSREWCGRRLYVMTVVNIVHGVSWSHDRLHCLPSSDAQLSPAVRTSLGDTLHTRQTGYRPWTDSLHLLPDSEAGRVTRTSAALVLLVGRGSLLTLPSMPHASVSRAGKIGGGRVEQGVVRVPDVGRGDADSFGCLLGADVRLP